MHVHRRYTLVFLWLGLLAPYNVVVVAQKAPAWVRYAWGSESRFSVQPYDITLTSDGQVYVASRADFLPNGIIFSTGDQPLAVPAGAEDASYAFLAQYDLDGQVNWIRRGAPEPQIAQLSYALAHYHVTPLSTAGVVVSEGLPQITDTNMFAGGGLSLHRYAATGEREWSYHIGTSGARFEQKEAFIRGMGSNATGNIYVAGVFNDTLTIGNETLVPISSPDDNGQADLFIASFSADGTPRWAQSLDVHSSRFGIFAYVQDFVVSRRGDIYLGGFFGAGSHLGDSTPALTRDANAIVKYNTQGELLWVRTDYDGSLHLDGTSVVILLEELAISSDDDLFVGWDMPDQGTRTRIVVGEQLVSDTRGGATFVSSYSATGELRWVQQAKGNGHEQLHDLAVTASGDLVVAGDFDGSTLTLDGMNLDNATTGPHPRNGFLAYYNQAGQLVGAAQATGGVRASFLAAAVGPSGEVFTAGTFEGSVDLGDSATRAAQSLQDLFVAKYTFAEPTSREDAAGIAPDREVISIATYPNPFSTSTTISYTLPEGSRVDLRVFDMLGREVATLVEGYQDAGYQSAVFAAEGVPSGLYVYRLQVGNQFFSDTVLLSK